MYKKIKNRDAMKNYKTISFIGLIFTLIMNYKCLPQNLNAEEIYSNFNEALVKIVSIGFNGNPLSQGSGVIISDSGYVVTNYHNFSGAEKIAVLYNGKYISGNEILGADMVRDLLVLKLKGNHYKAVKIADLSTIKVGQKIYTVGSPRGLSNTISEGIISGIRYDEDLDRNLIQFTAPITHGSSGGALLTESGELIGITSYGLGEGNINFAIPIDELKRINILPVNNVEDIQLTNLYMRGVNAYSAKYYDKAINYYKKFISKDSSKFFVYHNLGKTYDEIGKLDSAIVCLNISLQLNPLATLSYIILGNINIKNSDYKKATILFEKAIETDSTSTLAYNNLGAAYLYESDINMAISYFEKAIKINHYYVGAYSNLGVALKRNNEYDKAIKILNKALSYDSNSDLCYYNLGHCYAEKEDYYSAIEYYKKAVKINPKFISAYVDLGVADILIGDYDEALVELNRVLDLYDKNKLPKENFKNDDLLKTFLGLGEISYNNKKFDLALKYFNEASKYDSNNINVYKGLYKTYLEIKDSTNSIVNFIKVINQDTSKWRYYESIGNYYLRHKEYPLAIQNYRNYFQYNDNNAVVLYKIGFSYLYVNKLDSAKHFLKKSIQIDSTNAEAYNLVGVIESIQNNYDEALKMFFKSVELGESNAGVFYNIGKNYLGIGKKDEAIKYIKKSAEMGYQKAIEWMKRNKIDSKM